METWIENLNNLVIALKQVPLFTPQSTLICARSLYVLAPFVPMHYCFPGVHSHLYSLARSWHVRVARPNRRNKTATERILPQSFSASSRRFIRNVCAREPD